MNRIEQFLQDHKVLILDGAMATELESKGLDLNDALWSAKVLAEQPDVHHGFGSHCRKGERPVLAGSR